MTPPDIGVPRTMESPLAMLSAVARVIAETGTDPAASRAVVQAIAEAGAYPAGALWLADTSGQVLRCTEVWGGAERLAADADDGGEGAVLLRGSELPGRALATGRAVALCDRGSYPEMVAGDRATPVGSGRTWAAERDGLRSTFAMPFGGSTGPVAGVIELFARSARERSATFEEAAGIAGEMLAQLLLRSAAERALARAEQRFNGIEAAVRRSEAQLIEADRLAALGAMAAGVAHEINNPLSYVLLNLDLMLRDLAARPAAVVGEGCDLADRLRDARAGIERVRLIVQDLKALSRLDTERRGPIDVRRVLDSTIEFAGAAIRHRAQLSRDYAAVPLVDADPSRLGQVFLNLLVNAAQSMGEGAGRRQEIRIATGVTEAGEVLVEIADTGLGIAPEIVERIFDPFFTTKPSGVGTGLGLSICHGIVTSLGGTITVESRIGEGSTFRVVLPVIAAGAASAVEAPAGGAPADARSPTGAPPARRGRVLVIDDEPVLATALGRSLEQEYDVVVLSSGRQALERLRGDEDFDAILCDLIMPAVTGMDLYEAVKRDRPALADRMIFMTGGTFTARARDFLASIPNPALDKPFDLPVLYGLLRERTAAR